MPERQIFFDPQRTRWKRLRRILDITAVVSTLVLAGFIFNVLRVQPLPELLFPNQKHTYRALQQKERKHAKRIGTHRKTKIAPSQVVLNKDEGIRGAFYVTWDAASFS